jgi:hypothetical protein
VALPLLAAAPVARLGHPGGARASRAVAVVAGVCLVASTFGPAHGLWQRLGLTVGDGWIVVTALVLALGSASRRHAPRAGLP